jgi:hypothetical protein
MAVCGLWTVEGGMGVDDDGERGLCSSAEWGGKGEVQMGGGTVSLIRSVHIMSRCVQVEHG